MLKLDINGLSHDEVVEIVLYYCCQFGQVESLKLIRRAGDKDIAYAFVQMKDPEQHRMLASHIGDRDRNGCVIIQVMQETFDPRRSPSLAGAMRLPAKEHGKVNG
jgi:hypothetical protein